MVFTRNKKSGDTYGSNGKCTLCDGEIDHPYLPMEKWGIDGRLCGKCYSKKLVYNKIWFL